MTAPWWILCLLLVACGDLPYYLQAGKGQWQLLRQRNSINTLLQQEDIRPELRQLLEQTQAIRSFASSRLALPDNGSYRSYVDTGRRYASWTVTAAQEFSLQAQRWCFLFFGCVPYRGYFDATEAHALAEHMQQQGYDTSVRGVAAYSTLGWFDDPLLNTMLHWPLHHIAGLIFHELAHQQLYVQDDSSFNESFATAIEQAGVSCWLQEYGNDSTKAPYQRYWQRKQKVQELLAKARADLQTLYQSQQAEQTMREAKKMRLNTLQQDYHRMRRNWSEGPYFDGWFNPLNNATLALHNTYTRWVPAFHSLLRQCHGDFACFYQKATILAGENPTQRQHHLKQLTQSYPSPFQCPKGWATKLP